jgi:hypothetical protein
MARKKAVRKKFIFQYDYSNTIVPEELYGGLPEFIKDSYKA